MRVPVNELVLIVLSAILIPHSKRPIQAALWLVCESGDRILHIAQLRAGA